MDVISENISEKEIQELQVQENNTMAVDHFV